jgi:hypothetical protein
MSILVVTTIEANRFWGIAVLRVWTRVNLRGTTISKIGRKYRQHATMMPVLIWAIAHMRVIPER